MKSIDINIPMDSEYFTVHEDEHIIQVYGWYSETMYNQQKAQENCAIHGKIDPKEGIKRNLFRI